MQLLHCAREIPDGGVERCLAVAQPAREMLLLAAVAAVVVVVVQEGVDVAAATAQGGGVGGMGAARLGD